MYFNLILFFASLIALSLMIGLRLKTVRENNKLEEIGDINLVPDLQKIKYFGAKFLKKSIYIGLFISIRTYLLSSNFLKNKAKEVYIKYKEKFIKKEKLLADELKEKEVSKYLKVISDYRHKIRKIKNHIKEEEGLE